MEFTGPATKFTEGAIAAAAQQLNCDVAAVKAVIDVESKGGFQADTRPKILFERHLFHRLTGGRFSAAHPDISNEKAGGYAGGAAEYDRLNRAIALDRAAALKSASWGAFQILGRNHEVSGFSNVDDFCTSMCNSEDDHLKAFIGFVKGNHLDDELRSHNWAGFARGYNGPNFRINRYDEKLAQAHARHSASAGGQAASSPAAGAARTLRMGDEGPDVKAMQKKLGVAADGDFGPGTKRALIEFQRKNGLTADGVAGPKTLARLLG
jgi:hypothetical protein